VWRLSPELWQQKNWLLHHDSAPSQTTWLSSSTHPTFLFPWLKIKLRGRHFDTVEVIEAESQVIPDTFTEHDFRMHFKNGRSTGSSAYARKGTTLRMMVASMPNISFWLDGSTSPANYGCFFVWLFVIQVIHVQ
jgi:hypothetical protein